MIDDLEDRLLPRFRGNVCREQSSDSEMGLRTQCWRYHRVSGFLHPVVDELVGTLEALDQFLTDRFRLCRVDVLRRRPENDRMHRDFGGIAETGHLLQRQLRFGRQAGQLRDQEVHHIIRVTLGVNALEIPGPARSLMIKGEHSVGGERRDELNGEERIATRLLVHQSRERRAAFRLAAKGVRNQLPEMLSAERPKRDLLYLSAGGLDRVELAHERMRWSDFVVAVGTDKEKIAEIGPAQQVFQQVERRRVEPLQVIKEQRQGMFRPREGADELPKHQLEAPLCILWRKLKHRQRLTDDELHFRNEIHNQPCVRSQRLPQRVAPLREVRFAFAEQRPDQVLKRLCQRRVRNVAFVLIELAGSEKAARRDQHRLQLVDDRGLADAGIARDQDQFRGATLDDAIEGGEQGLGLALPSVEFLGDQQPVGRVAFAEWKVVNPVQRLPFGLAAAQVAF